MKNKKHLTKEGLEQIKKIKPGMNRGKNNIRFSLLGINPIRKSHYR